MNHKLIFYCICMLLFTSCIKQINLYTGDDEQHEAGNNDDEQGKASGTDLSLPFMATKCREISQPASS